MIGIVILIFCLLIAFLYYKHLGKMSVLEEKFHNELVKERAKAVSQSKAVTRGQISEQFIPLFPDFPYNLGDIKFSGQPIDYLVFKGMTELRDNQETEVPQISIIFADVKVGTAQTTKIQKGIKNAIEEGRVSWETWKIEEDKKIKIC